MLNSVKLSQMTIAIAAAAIFGTLFLASTVLVINAGKEFGLYLGIGSFSAFLLSMARIGWLDDIEKEQPATKRVTIP